MRVIELNMVLGSRHQPRPSRQGDDDAIYRDTDEPGEGANTGASGEPGPQGEQTTPVYLNVDHIASFYRRQKDRAGNEHAGTRIYLNHGGHIIVSDTIDVVVAAINGEQAGR
jgi:hypothetical protein